MPSKTVDQSKQRRNVIATDQFGREWAFSIELITGDPCGGIVPHGWSDLQGIHQKYLKVPRKNNMPVAGRIEIDFDRWINDQKAADKGWMQVLNEEGRRFYKKPSPQDVREWTKDDMLLEMAGPRPYPPVVILEKWKAGNHTFGTEAEATESEEPFKEMTYQQFLSQAMKKDGKTMAEAAAAWKVHKENLAEMRA